MSFAWRCYLHGCFDTLSFWQFINAAPRDWFRLRWVPSHLDASERALQRQRALDDALVDIDDIAGNAHADRLAADGARKHRVCPWEIIRAYDRSDLTKLIQGHLVRSWAEWITQNTNQKVEQTEGMFASPDDVLPNDADLVESPPTSPLDESLVEPSAAGRHHGSSEFDPSPMKSMSGLTMTWMVS